MLDCNQIPKFDVRPWQSTFEDPHSTGESEITKPAVSEMISQLDSHVLNEAVERARLEMEERKRFEYEAWLAREYRLRQFQISSFFLRLNLIPFPLSSL